MNALVLGGADCLWDDLDTVPRGWPDMVVGTNEAAAHYPGRLDHFVTLHPEKLPGWCATRQALGGNMTFVTWGRVMPHGARRRHDLTDRTTTHWGGSSGLLAVKVALELGATRVVLCGVPMQPRPHFFDDAPWGGWDVFRNDWLRYADRLEGRVRSCSGWTRTLLGAPGDWLKEAA